MDIFPVLIVLSLLPFFGSLYPTLTPSVTQLLCMTVTVIPYATKRGTTVLFYSWGTRGDRKQRREVQTQDNHERTFWQPTNRLTHQLADIGWVDVDFCSFTLCPIRLMRIWQNRLRNWARWRDINFKVNASKVCEQMNHPVRTPMNSDLTTGYKDGLY